jgi:hypothetical protein
MMDVTSLIASHGTIQELTFRKDISGSERCTHADTCLMKSIHTQEMFFLSCKGISNG